MKKQLNKKPKKQISNIFKFNKLLCIGHRGAKGHAPENTLCSIRKAIELGAPCVEVDVYYIDGNLIVFHDNRLERTTNGSGYLVEKSFKQLRVLDAGNGERIPTLKEVCTLLKSKAGINIELKGVGIAEHIVKFVSVLRNQGWSNDLILVSSFNREELLKVREVDRRVKLGVLISRLSVNDIKFATKIAAYSIHLSLKSVTIKFINIAHSQGLKVFVYTVNHLDDLMRMEGLGVDGIFTDFPERVIENKTKVNMKIGWI